jgi:hypothetical protein
MDNLWQDYSQALECGFTDWETIWGDPFITASVAMTLYFGAAIMALRNARLLTGRERWFWRICSFVLLFQVANTPLDMHAFVWTTGRCLAHIQGWYKERQSVQIMFLLIVAGIVACVILIALVVFYRNIMRNFLAVTGITIALGLTAVKGISLHQVNEVFKIDVGPFKVADLIENFGVILALIGGLLRWRSLQAGAGSRPDV